MPTTERPGSTRSLIIILVMVAVIVLLIRNSSIFKLFGAAADTGAAAIKTVRRVGADIDPFNPRGKLHRAGDKAVSSTVKFFSGTKKLFS